MRPRSAPTYASRVLGRCARHAVVLHVRRRATAVAVASCIAFAAAVVSPMVALAPTFLQLRAPTTTANTALFRQFPRGTMAGSFTVSPRSWASPTADAAGPRPTAQAAAGSSTGADQGEAPKADRLKLMILTPTGESLKTDASEVVLPGAEGRLGILRGHAPMIAPVGVGLLRYRRRGAWAPVILLGGYASVDRDVVKVLVEDAVWGNSIRPMEDYLVELDAAKEGMSSAISTKQRLDAKGALKKATAGVQAASLLSGKKRK